MKPTVPHKKHNYRDYIMTDPKDALLSQAYHNRNISPKKSPRHKQTKIKNQIKKKESSPKKNLAKKSPIPTGRARERNLILPAWEVRNQLKDTRNRVSEAVAAGTAFPGESTSASLALAFGFFALLCGYRSMATIVVVFQRD
ncbi:hypothetical protein AVEN_167089-1 [Araneus ventricosus]|uniref:Uncharacterized protein n=1 Tax=Araneus ventricosus TaxID=182803 RepID=A0A4Y2CQY4_ARAVE|nr:hypothetical protein AVEN_167089-1 [Araneus ventricosus]